MLDLPLGMAMSSLFVILLLVSTVLTKLPIRNFWGIISAFYIGVLIWALPFLWSVRETDIIQAGFDVFGLSIVVLVPIAYLDGKWLIK